MNSEITLEVLLKRTGLSQVQLVEKLGISKGGLHRLIKQNIWPWNPAPLKRKLYALLKKHATREEIHEILQMAPAQRTARVKAIPEKEAVRMIRKQSLTPQAKRHFQIPREIFSDRFCGPEDLFWSNETRYLRECLYNTAKHGGMLALVGESGSGKSTLRRDLIDRVEREDNNRILIIEPYIVGMDDTKAHHVLRAVHITDAILAKVAPSMKTGSSPESKFRAMHKALKDSHQAGFKHCLIIEEAHSLTAPTIKHLKRFYELEAGLSRLLSIILIGQPELANKLSERSPEVREVVQRMELLQIAPMDDLPGYVKHRCSSAGANFDAVFVPDAMDALTRTLNGPGSKDGQKGVSLLYPLIVGNTLTKAINLAAGLGMERVDADAVRRV